MAIPALPMMDLAEAEDTTISFDLPAGFAAPEGTEEGSAFDVVANVRIEDGKVILDSVNGIKIGAPMAEEEEVEETTMENEEEVMGGDGESLGAAMQAAGIGI